MSKNKVEISGLNTSSLKSIKYSEMKNLFIDLKNGKNESREKLIKYNLKLVLSILKKYQNRCDNLDDLFQIGVVGLIKSIDNFDLSFNVMFSTYAVFMIEGEIKRYLRDNNAIRISRSTRELSYEIVNYKENYLSINHEYLSNEKICEQLKITSYELYNALNSLSEPVSIFEPVYNNEGDTIYLLDQIEDSTKNDIDSLLALKEALNKIKDREKTIIIKRFYLGKSQGEIAKELSISQAQVSRIENNAINNIRKLIL